MILYLDSRAMVKRYVEEPGTEEVARALGNAALVGLADLVWATPRGCPRRTQTLRANDVARPGQEEMKRT